MTRHIAIYQDAVPPNAPEHDWRPWINTGDGAQLPEMALHRWLRDRGGILPDEKPLKVFVLVRETMDFPCTVTYTEFRVAPEQAVAA